MNKSLIIIMINIFNTFFLDKKLKFINNNILFKIDTNC